MTEGKWTKPTQYRGYPWPEIALVVGILIGIALTVVFG